MPLAPGLRVGRRLAPGLCGALALGCPGGARSPEPSPPPAEERAWQRCEEPRPKRCAPGGDPVCAQRDTGIRCVTTPCDSSEERAYPSACHACRDTEVFSWSRGPC